jgi:hypothetical protein
MLEKKAEGALAAGTFMVPAGFLGWNVSVRQLTRLIAEGGRTALPHAFQAELAEQTGALLPGRGEIACLLEQSSSSFS